MNPKNIFDDLPEALEGESVEKIVEKESVRVERIVSRGHASPRGFWYDQDEHEWVVLLSGAAGLSFEDEEEAVILHAGDYVFIPAHKKHRVDWTSPEEATVWLAVFCRSGKEA